MAVLLAEIQATLTPKILTINDASRFAGDVIKNPPQNAWEMLQVANSAFDVSGTVALGIAAAFPVALPVLPLIKGVFDLFSGVSGPSIGQVTLEAVQAVSQQIAQGFAAIEDTIEKVSEFQATRTIDTVLSGVNEIAREASAVNVYQAFTANDILNKLEVEKAAVFAEYTEQLNATRAAWVADVSEALKLAQEKTNAQYKIVQEQLASIAGGLFGELSDKLKKAADDAQELLEIQRQIDEINKLINDGALPIIAVNLIREFYGLT